jgi:hypothetical protein
MESSILYLGDTNLQGAAAYLTGVMTYYGIAYEYHRSDEKYQQRWCDKNTEVVILSDYPSCNFSPSQLDDLAERVKSGMSLIMIGGWGSFVGVDGNYQDTCLSDVLPIVMRSEDDRVNYSGPCLLIKQQNHSILGDLPFDDITPAIGGFNQFEAKPGTTVLLNSKQMKASRRDDKICFEDGPENPLLVLGKYGNGKVAALATDVAPHWVGPFVDWGAQRIQAKADGADDIEVGQWYAEFFRNLIEWSWSTED